MATAAHPPLSLWMAQSCPGIVARHVNILHVCWNYGPSSASKLMNLPRRQRGQSGLSWHSGPSPSTAMAGCPGILARLWRVSRSLLWITGSVRLWKQGATVALSPVRMRRWPELQPVTAGIIARHLSTFYLVKGMFLRPLVVVPL